MTPEEMAQEEYKTAWTQAAYIVAGWWKSEKESSKEIEPTAQTADN